MELLAVASVLGYVMVLHKAFRWKASVSLLPVICAIICLLFAAGLVGILSITAKILLTAGLIFLLAVLPEIWKERGADSRKDQGLIYFLAASGGLYLLTRLGFYSQLHSWTTSRTGPEYLRSFT